MGIHAELELLRSPSSKDISSPLSPQTQKRESLPKDEKSSLVASFFSGQNRVRSGSISMESKTPLQHKIESPKLMGGLQKSSTASDISAYLKHKFEDNPSPLQSPKKIMPEVNSPLVQRAQGLTRSSSFSKFKDSFEDGVGLMDAENVDTDKVRVDAELNALKSSTKIQKMFRINKSSRASEEQKTREEVPAPEIVNPPSSNYSERNDRKSNRNEPKKEEELQDRKWVFDTIQRYYDVIVEEEEEEDDQEEDEDDDGEEESESDYDSAEDEIPDISLPPINKTLPSRQLNTSTHRASPSLSLPMQRARASTVSPLCLPQSYSQRKSSVTSVLSIDDFVEDAARQFDQLTDGEDFDVNESETDERTRALYSTAQNRSSSSQSVNTLMRSGSSSKIRGLFSSVIHGSGSSLNVSTFKSNLMAHLQRRDSGNFDPGVDDDSSSEYSEYDD